MTGTKSNADIIQAHKRTIEVFTGQECTIILTDKTEAILKLCSLTEILLTCEKYNRESFSILSDSVNREVVNLRKIFCLLGKKAGYSARKMGHFMGKKDHTGAKYHIDTGEDLLHTDSNFKRLYNTVLTDLINYGQKLAPVK